MINFLLLVIIALMTPIFMFGLFVLILVLKAEPKGTGVDTSNRIMYITLLWFALTRRSLFLPVLPQLAHDQYDNIRK